MILSARERRTLTEIEARLVSADPDDTQRPDAIFRQITLRAAEPPTPSRGWRHIRAGVMVIFGITDVLGRKTIFRALYRDRLRPARLTLALPALRCRR